MPQYIQIPAWVSMSKTHFNSIWFSSLFHLIFLINALNTLAFLISHCFTRNFSNFTLIVLRGERNSSALIKVVFVFRKKIFFLYVYSSFMYRFISPSHTLCVCAKFFTWKCGCVIHTIPLAEWQLVTVSTPHQSHTQ